MLIFKGLALILFFLCFFVCSDLVFNTPVQMKTVFICAGKDPFKSIQNMYSVCDKVSELAVIYGI